MYRAPVTKPRNASTNDDPTVVIEVVPEGIPKQRQQANKERPPLSPESKANVRRALEHMRRQFRTAWASAPMGREPGMETGDIFASESVFADLMYNKHYSKCTVKVMEYSTLHVWESKLMDNKEFIDFVNTKAINARVAKLNVGDKMETKWLKPVGICSAMDETAKAKVTWINVSGISWDVIKKLQKTYSIHPLAVEEIMAACDPEKETQYSKLDYFDEHLYIRMIRHKLVGTMTFADTLRSNMPVYQSVQGGKGVFEKTSGEESEKSKTDVQPLKGKTVDGLPFQTTPLFVLLNRKFDTVITITSTLDGFTDPISLRMRAKHFSILRKASDASLLVHGVLDLAVEESSFVLNSFHERVCDLEQSLIRWHLSNLDRESLQKIHTLARDLTTILRSLRPIRDLIRNIRLFDVERFNALLAEPQPKMIVSASAPQRQYAGAVSLTPELSFGEQLASPVASAIIRPSQARGYFTPYARVYMADLLDRIEDLLANVEKFHDITENLSDHAFNAKAYEINEVMRILTFVNVVFLPMSIITAYFGMNFIDMSATRHTESFFWAVSIPIAVVLTLILFRKEVRRQFMHVDELRLLRRKRVSSSPSDTGQYNNSPHEVKTDRRMSLHRRKLGRSSTYLEGVNHNNFMANV